MFLACCYRSVPQFLHQRNCSESARIRAAEQMNPGAHSRVVVVESVTWDDLFPVGFDVLPGGSTGRALSYHYYHAPNIEGADSQVREAASDRGRPRI